MKEYLKGVGVGLPTQLISELDGFSSIKGLSRSETIRLAISVGLPMLKLGIAVNTRRTLQILEYTQLALSMKVEREYPADAQQLLTMAMRNVDDYHG